MVSKSNIPWFISSVKFPDCLLFSKFMIYLDLELYFNFSINFPEFPCPWEPYLII